MKLRIILLAAIVLMISSMTLQAQEIQTPPIRKVSISNFYVQLGLFTMLQQNGTLADFQALAPESDLLKIDFAGYTLSNGKTISSNSVFSIMLGLKFGDKQKTAYKANPELKLGVSYFTGNGFSASLNRIDRKPWDTLTSSQTGGVYYLDSVTNRTTMMSYDADQIRLCASLIFRTDPKARWSLYAGIGISAGMSLHARTSVSNSTYNNTEGGFENQSTFSSIPSDWALETASYNNKTNLGFSTFVPMGIDFRLGKKREFWKRTHLFYELGPGVSFTVIPELRTITSVGLQHGFGLRVSVD